VTLKEAQVAQGGQYWRIVDVKWQDEQQSGGQHHIFVDMMDEQGNRLVGSKARVSFGGNNVEVLVEDKPAPEFGGNFAMFNAGCTHSLEGIGLPSDRLDCLGLGSIEQRNFTIHVNYLVTFQRATKGGGGGGGGGGGETPGESLQQALLQKGEAERKIRLNPGAALQQVMLADDFIPTSEEFDLTHGGAQYKGQIAERLSDGAVRVYFGDMVNGQWAGNVRFVQR
jgi:hypothetical protein